QGKHWVRQSSGASASPTVTPAPATTEQQTASNGQSFATGDVIRLVKAGVPDNVIMDKIQGCNCQLDSSTDSLLRLKEAGASAAVMQAVVNRSANTSLT